MSQKNHIEYAQGKGSTGGIFLPFKVLKEAQERYYLEDLSSTVPTNITLQEETAQIKVNAIGGGVMLRANTNVSKDEAVQATAILTLIGAIVPGVHAESVLTTDTTAPANNSIVTIDDVIYTFVTTLSTGPAVPYEVLIGASAATALDNLKSAINGTAGEGTTYSTGTEPHPTVVATDNTDTTQKVVARVPGVDANAIVTTASTDPDSHLDWADTTLGGGTGDSEAGVDGETVTVRDEVYTFVTVLSETNGADAIPNQVLFGADSAAALDNLALAVNGDATEGTNYSTGTGQPEDVLATTNTDTAQTFEAQTLGEPGNAYTVETDIANGSFGVGVETFTGGSTGANFDAYIASGESVEFGRDDGVQAISLIAVGSTTDVAVVEY